MTRLCCHTHFGECGGELGSEYKYWLQRALG
ncbi:uncharacterized protein G2W53_000888 [Senna tora]|uniref:Uncharacterized protein n=1 Tax=Senna tora TaxID=362788 RepID=A0A834XEW9_9FABA|nr:uncharacterized protein G2W53_000888 [Senna tora]